MPCLSRRDYDKRAFVKSTYNMESMKYLTVYDISTSVSSTLSVYSALFRSEGNVKFIKTSNPNMGKY